MQYNDQLADYPTSSTATICNLYFTNFLQTPNTARSKSQVHFPLLNRSRNLYASLNFIRAIKSRTVRQWKHVAWQRLEVHKKWYEDLKEKAHSEDLGVNGTILKGILGE